MVEDNFMVPVRKAELEVGKPLGFAAYDADHNLLLNRGVVVTSENQIEVLLQKGLYRERVREKTGHVSARLDDGKPAELASIAKPQEENLSFDAIKLMPGDALQLQPMLEGQVERFTVHVIGVMKPKSVLVTMPVVEGKLVFVRDGQTYLVRAFSGLNVCAFKAKVLKSQLQPFPYLHLSYPDSVQAMRIRRAMRAPASIIVAVQQSEEGKQIGAGKMVDISVGGAKMFSPMQLGQKGDNLWLSFKVKLGDMEEYVKTPVVIRSIGEEDDEQGKRMKAFGIQFGDLVQSQRLIIMNLVYQHLLKEGV
ncbi:MAG: flagellar brake protein [Pseudomonadota bacterium]|nr:flagellar brake protein [Pseudomonadota bacterium]MDP1904348.1 flagellar brake protein [Pseudomonadota bacterium]MDP2353475.1 flagellar brake protein [Pseudomonadota bacterium]